MPLEFNFWFKELVFKLYIYIFVHNQDVTIYYDFLTYLCAGGAQIRLV